MAIYQVESYLYWLLLFYCTLLNVACNSRNNMDIEVCDESKPEINSGGMFDLYANDEVM